MRTATDDRSASLGDRRKLKKKKKKKTNKENGVARRSILLLINRPRVITCIFSSYFLESEAKVRPYWKYDFLAINFRQQSA